MSLPTHPTPRLRKRADGSIWEASWQTSVTGEDLWAIGLFNPARAHYYRKLIPNIQRKWFTPWRPIWIRTGEIWEGSVYQSIKEFEHIFDFRS